MESSQKEREFRSELSDDRSPNHVGTDVRFCPAERGSAFFSAILEAKPSRTLRGRTDEDVCP